MSEYPNSYLSPKLEARRVAHGFGSFAREEIYAGELLTMWGGQILPEEAFMKLSDHMRSISIQVEDGLFLVPIDPEEADYFNHSCNPNAGLQGSNSLIATRDIMPGEEICFDYAMSDSVPYDEFTCGCGAYNCRGTVTGNDWQIAELWDQYRGYFSPYLQRKIDSLQLLQVAIPSKELLVMA